MYGERQCPVVFRSRKISNDEVRVRVIHAGVGAISKSDVDLADASNAIIIGFNVRPDNVAKEEAAATKVEMRMYRVIYDAINDVTDAMKGMLAPKFREVSLGELQVRQVYKISNVGTVAGCRVTSGKITRDSKVRVVRDGIVITEDEIASLKRFKDDAKEVAEGYECLYGCSTSVIRKKRDARRSGENGEDSVCRIGYMTGEQAVKILTEGADISKMPIGYLDASKCELSVNEETAQTLGIDVSGLEK